MHPLLAGFGIELSHGGNTVRLRPSLQAAMRLERLHDGFAPLFRRIEAFDTQTVRNVILIAATDQSAAERFLAWAARQPLATFQDVAQSPMMALCEALLPNAANTPKRKGAQASAKPVPWVEAFADLFAIATGVLHWTPQAAWQATPTEIATAFNAHIAMLEAMHGTNDDPEEQPDAYSAERLREIEVTGADRAFDRQGLSALKQMLEAD
jgi:hypothetical protein